MKCTEQIKNGYNWLLQQHFHYQVPASFMDVDLGIYSHEYDVRDWPS